MSDAVLLIAIGFLFFLFAGTPDFHDLILQKLSGECQLVVQKE